jgi:hypothetical protein
MQRLTSSWLILTTIAGFGILACQKAENKSSTESSQANQVMQATAIEQAGAKLRHVVLFKFKEDADPAAIKKVEEAFAGLPAKIPQIRDFEWGMNNSPEGLNKGFTHCFLLTFGSEEDRAVYLPHPDHKAFGALLGDILEDVTVVDYWTK